MGSTASVPRFRSSKNVNGLGINDLNYELISYAINQNAFIYQNGMFELKDNVEIYWSDTLFKSLSPRNFDNFITKVEGNNFMFYLVDGGKCIIIHLDQDYYNLYSIDDFKPSYTKSSDTKLDIINSQDLLSNIKFEFDNLSYEYYNENIDDNNVYLNVKMPGYIFIDGVPYKISIKTEKNDHSELIYNGLSPSQIIIDSSTLVSNKVFNEGSTTTIKFQLYLDDLNIILGNKKNVMSISIYHGQSTDVLIDSYDLYVEALKDDVGYYITSGVITNAKSYVINYKRESTTEITRSSNVVHHPYFKGDKFKLYLNRLGQRVIVRVSNEEFSYENEYLDFDLQAHDFNNMYVGLFATNGTIVKYSNINFKITGNAKEA